MLAPLYGRFTHGLDTADLKDAKAQLVELGGRALLFVLPRLYPRLI